MNNAQKIYQGYRVKTLGSDLLFVLLTAGLVAVSIWQWNLSLFFWAFLGWCVLYLLWQFLKKKARKNLQAIVYNRCDPQTYREVYTLILQNKKLNLGKVGDKIELAFALIFLGEYQQAEELLNSIDIKSKFVSKNLLLRWYNLMSKCYARMERWEDLERIQEDLSILIKTGKLRANVEQTARTALASAEMEICMHRRQLIKAREYQEKRLKKVKVLYLKVSICYQLALIDLMEGKLWDAKERLEFVARKGNTMLEARLAREKLPELEQVEPPEEDEEE